MTATLSGKAADRSFLSFVELYKEFAPLTLNTTNNPDIAIKIAESAKRTGIDIELSESDIQMLKKSKYADLYAAIE
jgi:hypothetical protein